MNSTTAGRVSFIVTGFGPFNGVPENPTTALVEKLISFLQSSDSGQLGPQIASRTHTVLLETAAEAVREEITRLSDQISKEADQHGVTFLVHLGVDGRGKHFKLETCAYNDATFRFPDERGFQPNSICISEGSEWGSPMETLVNTARLVDHLKTFVDSHQVEVSLSTDPGRFVCNYTYYYSMNMFQGGLPCLTSSEGPFIRSLFVHVPPFSEVSESNQLIFVGALLEGLLLQYEQDPVEHPL